MLTDYRYVNMEQMKNAIISCLSLIIIVEHLSMHMAQITRELLLKIKLFLSTCERFQYIIDITYLAITISCLT